jgi:hypothetical protein
MKEFYYTDCSGDRWVDDHGEWKSQAKPCAECHEPTHRLDYELHCYVHAGGCEDALWRAYFSLDGQL